MCNICVVPTDSYAAATVVLQDDHKLIFDSLERHWNNAAVVSSALNALEVHIMCINLLIDIHVWVCPFIMRVFSSPFRLSAAQ